MKRIIEQIADKNYKDASDSIVEAIDTIMSRKLVEAKKIVMAKKFNGYTMDDTDHPDFVHKRYRKTDNVDFVQSPSVDKLKRGLTNLDEDDDEGYLSKGYNAVKNYVKNNSMSTIANKAITTGIEAIPKIETKLAGPVGIALDVALGSTPANAGEDEQLKKIRAGEKATASNDKEPQNVVNEKTSPYEKIRRAMAKKGIDINSDKHKKKNERLDAEYQKLKDKDKKIAEEVEELNEARIKIVKARVRGGKIQRRKKVSNVPGMTLRGGRLTRMSPTERRHRKMGQRKGKIKRRAKLNRALMKRARSIRKREALGL